MIRKILLSIVVGLIVFRAAWAAEVVKIEGGGAATAAIFYPLKESYEEDTGNTLLVKMSTPVEGLIALEKGQVDIATGAVPIRDLISGAKKAGVTIDPATLEVTELGMTSTVVFVHKPSKVDALSKEQLKGIFTGKITNWRELGEADQPIDVIWGTRTPGQNALFTRMILDGEAVTPKATLASDYEDIRKMVIMRPGAIGIDPVGLKMGAVKVPATPHLPSKILAITKGKPSPTVQKLFDYYRMSLFQHSRELLDKQ